MNGEYEVSSFLRGCYLAKAERDRHACAILLKHKGARRPGQFLVEVSLDPGQSPIILAHKPQKGCQVALRIQSLVCLNTLHAWKTELSDLLPVIIAYSCLR